MAKVRLTGGYALIIASQTCHVCVCVSLDELGLK